MNTPSTAPPRRKPTIRELADRYHISKLALWKQMRYRMSLEHIEMVWLNMPMSHFFIEHMLIALNALTGQHYTLSDVSYTMMPDTRKERRYER